MRYIFWGLMVVNSLLLFSIISYTDKAQSTCVGVGNIGPGELTKICFSVQAPDYKNIKQSMIDTHATAGAVLVLAGVMFFISSASIALGFHGLKMGRKAKMKAEG